VDSDPKDPADFVEDFYGWIPPSLLNPSQIGAIDITIKGQLLLSKLMLLPQFKNYLT